MMYSLMLNSQSVRRISDNAIIPMDDGNADYQSYLAWVAAGNTPEPESRDPVTVPLTGVQFHAMIGILGLTEAVNTAVAALDEPQRSIARARINHSGSYRRDNPLFAQLGAMVGMTDVEIDAAWPQALAIE